MKSAFVHCLGWVYRNIGTRIFFLFESEPIHEAVVVGGKYASRVPGLRAALRCILRVNDPMLETDIAGIHFENPVGMAAGFDYDARLTQFVSGLGIGFESIGTVTNLPYAGNPAPMMKRLVKSKSLLINKGFKSSGMDAILARLTGASFDIPIGISIGRTNTEAHEDHTDAITDIIESFKKVERSGVPFSYFELNISCPNLKKDISFYRPERMRELLEAIFALQYKRPLFVKMPTILSDAETLELFEVVRQFPVAAVIVGNLRKDRTGPGFDAGEMGKFGIYKGNWSGLPCKQRSDELVRLLYRHSDRRIAIIGCGGIFNAEDAYKKIRMGSSAVQIATGYVFSGPQLAAEICADLPGMLRRDGFSNVSEAVGVDA